MLIQEILYAYPVASAGVLIAAVTSIGFVVVKTPILRALSARLPKLWLILKCLALGYIAGSIHAPFGIEWRTTSALPSYETILPTLPVEEMDINDIEDDIK